MNSNDELLDAQKEYRYYQHMADTMADISNDGGKGLPITVCIAVGTRSLATIPFTNQDAAFLSRLLNVLYGYYTDRAKVHKQYLDFLMGVTKIPVAKPGASSRRFDKSLLNAWEGLGGPPVDTNYNG